MLLTRVPCVPCDVCGTYFPDRRIMLSHRARKHPENCEPKTRMTAEEYAGSTVDGMPQCAKCGCKFTRVEGLKKHLRKECRPCQLQEPSVSATSVVATAPGTTTGQVAQGPTARRESPRGRLTSVVPQTDSILPLGSHGEAASAEVNAIAPTPNSSPVQGLIQDIGFQSSLRSGWKLALAQDSHGSPFAITACCADNGSSCGPGIKQHIRLMHPEAHAQHATAAASRSSHLGLTVTNPCHYCLQDVQDIRTHLKKCPVVFQASLAALVLVQDGRRGRSSICGTGGAAGSPGRRRPGIGIERSPWGQGWGRQQKWPRTDSKGKGPSGWSGWGSKRQWEEDEAEKGEAAKLDKQTQAVIQSLVQLSLRHEAELGRIRSESAFIFFLDMPGVNRSSASFLGYGWWPRSGQPNTRQER